MAGLDGGVEGRGEVVGLGVEVGFAGAGDLPGVGVGLLGLFMFVVLSGAVRNRPGGTFPAESNERARHARSARQDAISYCITGS